MPLGAARFGLSGADLGKLELIETQTSTAGTTAFDFTSLGSFNVHFITMTNMQSTSAENNTAVRVSNDGGSSFETTGYQVANHTARPVPYQQRSSSGQHLGFVTQQNTTTNGNGYYYLYNLLDSGKFTFATYHGISDQNDIYSTFGSGVYTTAEVNNAIRVFVNTDSLVAGAVVSLYGIKE
tara:strand:+ start:18 stop:560 length:543 start_codon:yes stop_codon:yes gene_type:complete